jgi:hypothetical protein
MGGRSKAGVQDMGYRIWDTGYRIIGVRLRRGYGIRNTEVRRWKMEDREISAGYKNKGLLVT